MNMWYLLWWFVLNYAAQSFLIFNKATKSRGGGTLKRRWYFWHRGVLKQQWMSSVVHLSQEQGLLQLPGQRGFDGSRCPEDPAAAAPARGSMCRTPSVASQRRAPSLPKTPGPLQTRLKTERREPRESAGSIPAFLCEPGYGGGELSLCRAAWPLWAKFRAVWAIKCDGLLASSPRLLAGTSSSPSWDQLN